MRDLELLRGGGEVEVVLMETHGDQNRRRGISPDFTGALEQALRSGAIDVAVHSAKDLAASDPPGLTVAAYPRRADPRDCFVARGRTLPRGARVGSSSVRRKAQLLRWRPDLEVREIRGNVDRRIGRVHDRGLDAVVVAKAGVDRLGRAREISGILPLDRFLPAPGQGALAVEARTKDRSTRRLLRGIDHAPTRAAVEAERALALALGASCNVPLGALARTRGDRLYLSAEILSADGSLTLRGEGVGGRDRPESVAREVARRLTRAGADALLPRVF